MRLVDVGSVGLIFLQYDVLSISSLSLFPLNSTFDADVGSVDSISTGPDFLLDDVLVSLSLHPFEEEYDLLGGKVNGESRNELLEYCLTGGPSGPQVGWVSRSVVLERCLTGAPPGIQLESALIDELPDELPEVLCGILDTCLDEYDGVVSRVLEDTKEDKVPL